jgi:hypothetical protein
MVPQFLCPICGATNQPEPGTSEYSIECSSCGKRIKVPGFENHRGIGTTFIGERDYATNGSYVTTKWFIFAGVPIFPICSHRVQFVGSSGLKEHYIFYATTRPNLKQVISTYAYGVFIVCWIYFVAFCMFHAPANAWIYVIGAVGITPGIVLPFALRRFAKRNLKHARKNKDVFVIDHGHESGGVYYHATLSLIDGEVGATWTQNGLGRKITHDLPMTEEAFRIIWASLNEIQDFKTSVVISADQEIDPVNYHVVGMAFVVGGQKEMRTHLVPASTVSPAFREWLTKIGYPGE